MMYNNIHWHYHSSHLPEHVSLPLSVSLCLVLPLLNCISFYFFYCIHSTYRFSFEHWASHGAYIHVIDIILQTSEHVSCERVRFYAYTLTRTYCRFPILLPWFCSSFIYFIDPIFEDCVCSFFPFPDPEGWKLVYAPYKQTIVEELSDIIQRMKKSVMKPVNEGTHIHTFFTIEGLYANRWNLIVVRTVYFSQFLAYFSHFLALLQLLLPFLSISIPGAPLGNGSLSPQLSFEHEMNVILQMNVFFIYLLIFSVLPGTCSEPAVSLALEEKKSLLLLFKWNREWKREMIRKLRMVESLLFDSNRIQ